tara:strand:- start:14240 stop:14629 length:390 start_codon:yes stop_codon:yes gene_type:complete
VHYIPPAWLRVKNHIDADFCAWVDAKLPTGVLLSFSWCLATVLNNVRLSASPCRGVSTKVFISPKKPELIARAFLWALVLRGMVVITPSMLAALFGRLARRLILLVMILALGVTTVTFRLWESLHNKPS